MNVINLAEKFASFADYANPRIVAELNGQHVKVGKLKGPFIWHHHENEDELFLVTRGTLRMLYRDGDVEREIIVRQGEFVVVPRGVDHLPIAQDEVHVLLIEPAATLNTGNVESERTRHELDRI